MYAAATKNKGNAADGLFSAACKGLTFYSSTVILAFDRDMRERTEDAGERSH
jgi:hypothetical protein